MPSFTQPLEDTLHRAVGYANERHHEFATLEHFLLALVDDPDARHAIIACGGDPEQIRADCLQYLDHDLRGLVSDQDEDAKPTAGFQRVIQRAVIHVQSSGKDDVTGSNVLVSIFSERESNANHILGNQGLTRFDVVQFLQKGITKLDKEERELFENISKSKSGSPNIVVDNERLSYRQAVPTGNVERRKEYLKSELAELIDVCGKIDNTHPALKKAIDRYSDALEHTTEDSGAYELFMLGLKLEHYFKIKSSNNNPTDDNPSLDDNALSAFGSFFPAHAGFVSLFPDVSNTMLELDLYKESLDKIDGLTERTTDPIINYLSSSKDIFDRKTVQIISEVSDLQLSQDVEPSSYRGEQAAKHNWLRGIFGAMGELLLAQGKDVGKTARDSLVKEGVKVGIRNHAVLTEAIVRFFNECREPIQALASKMSYSFGWLTNLLSHFFDFR